MGALRIENYYSVGDPDLHEHLVFEHLGCIGIADCHSS